jgi:Protein of unknown function (DUF1822)
MPQPLNLELIDFLDTEALTEEQIELSPAQIEQAVRLSQSGCDSSQQWQLYLHALGLLGFKQWLEEWAPDLEIVDACGFIDSPNHSLETCQISVEKFNLCLIAVSTFLDPTINLPQAIVELPQFIPHIYVLIEVQEEQMQVKVCGYLRQDCLAEQQRSHSLKPISNQHYSVPSEWFNFEPTELLLELRCLEPFLIILPSSLSSQPINVGHWLSDRLDDAARQLGWLLLPPLIPAAALRSAQEQLLVQGVAIPSEARGVYQELQLGTAKVRFQAITWVLSAASDAFAWTLLIILDGDRLPVGARLRIRDANQSLFEQKVEVSDSSLFAQVGGDLSDQFWVTIDLPDGTTTALPPFYFSLDQ